MAQRRTLEEANKRAEKLNSYIQKIQICPAGLMLPPNRMEKNMRTENQATPAATEKYNQAILTLLANKTEENFRPPFSLEITDSESGKCLYETKIEFDGEEPRWMRNYPRHEGPVFINVIGHCKMSQLVAVDEKLREASAAD